MVDDDEKRQIANEVEEGRFEAFVRDNREHLEKTFIEINKDDFEEFCRNDYEMFKNDWGVKMIKEYWLIKKITTTGHKNPIQIVDRLSALGLREVEKDFRNRNNFKKLLEKADLTIVRSEKYYQ